MTEKKWGSAVEIAARPKSMPDELTPRSPAQARLFRPQTHVVRIRRDETSRTPGPEQY